MTKEQFVGNRATDAERRRAVEERAGEWTRRQNGLTDLARPTRNGTMCDSALINGKPTSFTCRSVGETEQAQTEKQTQTMTQLAA